jgi:hypothetical protein
MAALLGIGLCQSCSVTRPVLEIEVADDGFVVSGQMLMTQAELTNAIRKSGATACHVIPAPTATYEQVAKAMVSVRNTGCRSGLAGRVGS